MARPKKQTVDYFPHSCIHGTTIFVLEQRFGNDGYAFWFKLLEELGRTEGHFLDLNKVAILNYLSAKCNVDTIKCREILSLLAEQDAIDSDLWAGQIVWSQKFVDGISDVYSRFRHTLPPQRPNIYADKHSVKGVSTQIYPQSKVKESKVKESKVKESKVKESIIQQEIIQDLNEKTGKAYKPTDSTKALIKARFSEGFTLEDFKKVHGNMSAKWKNDPKMNQYLRPTTLYQASKFEGYLHTVVSLSDRGIVSEQTERNLKILENYKYGGTNAE